MPAPDLSPPLPTPGPGPSGEAEGLAGPGAGVEWSLLGAWRAAFPAPEGALGIGDDAAAWTWSGEGQALACTDLLVEGRHFRRETTSPEALGWKALAVNLSDVAAMGGQAELALVNLGLDPEAPAWGPGVMAGLGALARRAGCWVAGGDTVGVGPGGAMLVGVSLVGRSPRPLRRDAARPGDCLLATGPWGASTAGLWALERPEAAQAWPKAWREAVLRWHRQPWPRLALGAALGRWAAEAEGRRLALLDDSDGLRRSAWLLAQASGLRVVLEEEALAGALAEAEGRPAEGQGLGSKVVDEGEGPAEAELRAWAWRAQAAVRPLAALAGEDWRAWALDGGEDYGLVGACAPEAVPELLALGQEEGLPWRVVGRLEEGEPGVAWEAPGRGPRALSARGGFAHLG